MGDRSADSIEARGHRTATRGRIHDRKRPHTITKPLQGGGRPYMTDVIQNFRLPPFKRYWPAPSSISSQPTIMRESWRLLGGCVLFRGNRFHEIAEALANRRILNREIGPGQFNCLLLA
jgi:hypothetical protein